MTATKKRLLEVAGLTMDFGGLRAIDSVGLEIFEGEIVALIGPNGAGKTTFFNCVTGIYEPTHGDVLIHPPGGDTRRINGMKPNRITALGMARTKLSAYALGAFWAGLVGVVFAAHNNFINPDSFTFMDSAMILAMVVLGGMGSILGVIIASLALKLLPEYLRAFAEYRMVVFGAVMVLMMVFRPQGLINNMRRKYEYDTVEGGHDDDSNK